jgi:hypothetical protein
MAVGSGIVVISTTHALEWTRTTTDGEVQQVRPPQPFEPGCYAVLMSSRVAALRIF